MVSRGTQDAECGLIEARRLRFALYRQLGLVSPLLLAACGTSEVAESEEGGVTTNQSSGEVTGVSDESEDSGDTDATQGSSTTQGTSATGTMTTTQGSSTTQDTDTTEDSADTSDEGPLLDVGMIPDVGEQLCTQEWFDPEMAEALQPECYGGPDLEYMEVCVPLPEDQDDCNSSCPDQLCPGMDSCIYSEPLSICGPYFEAEEHSCCVFVSSELLPPIGRPFVVEGQLRLACAPAGEAESELGTRARHWLDMARGEHASVAAFARFIAQLQACAAPAQLVAEAVRAAADEVRHTALALEVAEAAAGRALSLGPLRVAGAQSAGQSTLAAAVYAAVIEGCIGETLAAHEAACLAASVEDPQLAAVLETIAQDELRHAALAWRFVRWALARDPSLRGVVEQAFSHNHDNEGARGGLPASTSKSAEEKDELERTLLAFGCPPPRVRGQWRASAHAQIVAPCREAMGFARRA